MTADVRGAKTDLLESLTLNPSFTQSLVKLASVHMEEGDNAQAMKCFDDAININEDDPDVYYHRGQGAFIFFPLQQSQLTLRPSVFHYQ